jgi:cytochrome c oxidase cbb3-type subunit IV
METYETFARFAQVWGLLGFMALFAIVLFYALKPSNREAFDEAAQVPLEKD